MLIDGCMSVLDYMSIDYVISDYEFWARAIKSGAKCALLPIVVADYHYTGENTVLTKAGQIRRDHVRIAATYGTKTDKICVLLTQTFIGVLTNFLMPLVSIHCAGG